MLDKYNRLTWIGLAVLAVFFSRLFFFLINDPEGPNLLIVCVLSALVYMVSVCLYTFGPEIGERKKFLMAVLAQFLLVIILYLLFK